MNYLIGQYYNNETNRYQWAVCCSKTNCWYFAKRYGKMAAQKLCNRLNIEGI